MSQWGQSSSLPGTKSVSPARGPRGEARVPSGHSTRPLGPCPSSGHHGTENGIATSRRQTRSPRAIPRPRPTVSGAPSSAPLPAWSPPSALCRLCSAIPLCRLHCSRSGIPRRLNHPPKMRTRSRPQFLQQWPQDEMETPPWARPPSVTSSQPPRLHTPSAPDTGLLEAPGATDAAQKALLSPHPPLSISGALPLPGSLP